MELKEQIIDFEDSKFFYGRKIYDDGSVIPYCQPKPQLGQGVETFWNARFDCWMRRGIYGEERQGRLSKAS
jgi:hypothetical protein